MHGRYYGVYQGKFLSIDPGRDIDAMRPQSWNLYSYVRNNPLNGVDANGREEVKLFGFIPTGIHINIEPTPLPPSACDGGYRFDEANRLSKEWAGNMAMLAEFAFPSKVGGSLGILGIFLKMSGGMPAPEGHPSPGGFGEKDLAFGVHGNLRGFAGNARSMFNWSPPSGEFLQDTIKREAQETVARGGTIRFNLTGFDARAAMNPGSEFFIRYTSQEFRMVLREFLENAVFYKDGVVVPTAEVLKMIR
jgi:hypothetical protein